MMSYEEIKKFIEDNKITGRVVLEETDLVIYKNFCKLTIEEKDRLLPYKGIYSNFNTKEDFKKFITDNNIKSRGEFNDNYSRLYKLFCSSLTEEERNEILPRKNTIKYFLKTYSDFEKFIQENNIVSRRDFGKRFSRGYKRFLKILSEKEQDELLPSNYNDYSKLNTISDFEKFIQENNIVSRRDFGKRFYKGYERFLKILSEEEQNELLPSKVRSYSNLNTMDDFRGFIQENNIVSRNDFHRRFFKGYERFLKILSEEEHEELLPAVKSFGEISLRKLFDDNLINYVSEKTFKDLKGKKKHNLRYDFYLPDYNILIEYHGSQHFAPNSNLYTEEGIERDKMKFEYAKKNNIPILYFTYSKEVYKENGYFTEVITDSDILIEKIKEIGLTN